ncbi:hypothetical protein C8R47DRAFT_1213666 [Mycena vitilis]|nr:hypothetical protein C8R47DRAFT_1213666 [Mycena vitilis]
MVLASYLFYVVSYVYHSVFAVGVRPGQIKNLATFGDSYTDGTKPRSGLSIYASGYARVVLRPFARAGATCSNDLTFRPFPPLFDSQIPLYLTETANGSLHLSPDQTIYTLWIGTNDLGVSALLTGTSNLGVSLVDVTECMVNWVKVLYKNRARNFISQNMIPLELTILSPANSYPNKYWALERNTTEWSIVMTELTRSGNKLTQLMLQGLTTSLPEAHIGLRTPRFSVDSHSLFQDMFDHPELYLNGTAPLNVTGAWDARIASDGGATLDSNCSDQWLPRADELHASEQADRIVAREIALTLEGKRSRWVPWLS